VPLTVLVLLACGFLIGFEGRPSQSGPAAATFRPFVLYEKEVQFSPDNAVVTEVDYTVARRADGSLMKSYIITGPNSPDGNDGKAIMIWDVSDHQDIALEPFTKSVMTQHRSVAEIANFLASQHACSGAPPSSSRPRSTMLGRAVIQLTDKSEIDQSVSWVDPALDCYPLKKTLWLLDPPHKGSRHETEVTKIEEGDPPVSMFAVPLDYIERSPLEIEAEYAREYSGRPFFGHDAANNAERQYRQHQAK
jgi:hypothetical protein